MKKTIVLILLTFVLLTIHGCHKVEDEGVRYCQASYQIENQSSVVITVNVSGSGSQVIQSGEKKEVFLGTEICGKNTIMTEFQSNKLYFFYAYNTTVYADSRQINEGLIKRKWSFSATEYYRATYLLVITDELLESVGYVE